ncbi:MAG: hypothetical protein Kow0032_02140 [Methyloligellaceae bacterium]
MTQNDNKPGTRITRRRALLAASGAIVFAAAGGILAPLSPWAASEAHAASEVELMKEQGLPDFVLGEATAPNTVIEYSSMTCPHCARFHKNVLPELKSKYIDTGLARYIIREFPLDNLAFAAAMLARCAGEKKFFPFVEVIYAKQDEWAFGEGDPVDRLFKIAKQAGFTKESFESCLRDQKLLDGITAIRKRANEEFGVNSTPTLFVNGQLVKGASKIGDLEKHMTLDKKS